MKQKLLSLLVLLMTATTGVWADEVTIDSGEPSTSTSNPFGSVKIYSFEEQIYTASEIGIGGAIESISFQQAQGATTSTPLTIYMKHVDKEVFASDTDFVPVSDEDKVFEGTWTYLAEPGWITIKLDKPFVYDGVSNLMIACHDQDPGMPNVQMNVARKDNSFLIAFSSEVSDINSLISSGTKSKEHFRSNIKINIPLVLHMNAAKTEAWFNMPAYDATATYVVVRDMSVDMMARVGDGTVETPRFRVQQNAQSQWEPVGITAAQIPALFTVIDSLDAQNPDTLTQTTDYTVQIFALGDNNQPTGTAMTFADFTFAPGRYVVKAVAVEGSDYAGETAFSNVFQLYFGYPLEIAAGEFATFYKDEVLTTEDEDATLYTITSVSDNTVVLSSAISVAPASTPLIVYNGGSEKKTIVLLPSEDTPDEVNNVSSMFVGTLEASTIAASTATQTNYALNGREFVVVRSNLSVAANKCWLEVPAAQEAARLNIVFSDVATGISQIENGKLTIENSVYDLQGRRVESSIFNSQSSMLKKGIYIINGKKVVVK